MNFDGFNVINPNGPNVKSKAETSAESWTKFIKLSTTSFGDITFAQDGPNKP